MGKPRRETCCWIWLGILGSLLPLLYCFSSLHSVAAFQQFDFKSAACTASHAPVSSRHALLFR